MSRTRIIGIVLMVLAVLLLAAAIFQVAVNMDHTGPIAGKINSYRPPFPSHGLWVVVSGVLSAVTFLGGAAMVAFGRS
jgi:hypothetical protein